MRFKDIIIICAFDTGNKAFMHVFNGFKEGVC